MNWYIKIYITVRWCKSLSVSVSHSIKSGVGQGGILSPVLFSLYINSIIGELVSSASACHIGKCYIECLVHADDIILLSVSLIKLQNMLDIRYDCANSLNVKFNARNRVCLLLVKVTAVYMKLYV